MQRALVVAVALAALAAQAPGALAANPQLTGVVGPGMVITLEDANGTSLDNKMIAPGTYDIAITDSATAHNFHLSGPGVGQATMIATTSTVTWTVTFAAGQSYHFQCDAHPDSMSGDFATTGASPPPATHPLTVTAAGVGAGTVKSAPAGIDCGATCTANFSEGTAVTLTAVAVPGSAFDGWSGACSGIGTCSLTMGAPRAVTATFRSMPGTPPPVNPDPYAPPPAPSTPLPPSPPLQNTTPALTLRGFRAQVKVIAATRTLLVHATLGRRTTGVVQLLARGREVAHWRRTLRQGASTLSLVIPRRVKAGRYVVRLTCGKLRRTAPISVPAAVKRR